MRHLKVSSDRSAKRVTRAKFRKAQEIVQRTYFPPGIRHVIDISAVSQSVCIHVWRVVECDCGQLITRTPLRLSGGEVERSSASCDECGRTAFAQGESVTIAPWTSVTDLRAAVSRLQTPDPIDAFEYGSIARAARIAHRLPAVAAVIAFAVSLVWFLAQSFDQQADTLASILSAAFYSALVAGASYLVARLLIDMSGVPRRAIERGAHVGPLSESDAVGAALYHPYDLERTNAQKMSDTASEA